LLCLRIGPAVFGEGQLQPGLPRGGIKIRAPVPRGDGDVGLRLLCRDAHLFAAAPGERADIGVGQLVGAHNLARRLVELGDGIGNLEVENLGGLQQTLIVLGQLEDLAVVGAHAFEHGAAVMQRMGEEMNARIRPRDQLAVEPDKPLALIVGRHGLSSTSRTGRS
jgi:hypothetical protein